MKYQSGEEIRKGDRVRFHGQEGVVELLVDRVTGDPATDWYLREHGPGVLISEPEAFGRVFTRNTEQDEDLILLSRADVQG